VWIVQFGRETYEHPEPVQRLAVGTTVTWPAAFIISAAGDSIAIVGTGDVENVHGVGAYEEVIGYVKDVAQPLRDVLDRLAPARIGLSYSISDDSADNLAHGMYLMLQACLHGTANADRLVSADDVLVALRARKQPLEISRIRAAIDSTFNVFDRLEAIIFGAGDFYASQGARVDTNFDPLVDFPGDIWHYASARIVVAARTAGVDAIDALSNPVRGDPRRRHCRRQRPAGDDRTRPPGRGSLMTRGRVLIEARVRTRGRTGAEMEALVAVATAALTVYDLSLIHI